MNTENRVGRHGGKIIEAPGGRKDTLLGHGGKGSGKRKREQKKNRLTGRRVRGRQRGCKKRKSSDSSRGKA